MPRTSERVATFREAVRAGEAAGLTRRYLDAVSAVLDELELAADLLDEVSAIAAEARRRDLNNIEHGEEAIELNGLAVRTEAVLDRLSEKVYP